MSRWVSSRRLLMSFHLKLTLSLRWWKCDCAKLHIKDRFVRFAGTNARLRLEHWLRWPRVTTHTHTHTHNMSACALRMGRTAALTLTAGEQPSPGCDPCITPWWPLTSSSRFALTTPSAAVSAEGATFVLRSAQLLLHLCVVWAEKRKKKVERVRGRR